MSYLETWILSLVQGITEFIPISSSGHLVIVPYLMNFDKPPLFFDILVHIGTLFAVVFFLRKEIWSILYGIFQKSQARASWTLVLKIALALIPAVVAGLFLKDSLETLFFRPDMVGWAYFGTAAILFLMVLFYKGKKTMHTMTWMDALLIGIFQSMALVPGFSRSGFTLFGALIVGMERTEAFRFSFLISIPAILGAFILELRGHEYFPLSFGISATALIVSAVSGLIAIMALKHFLKKSLLHWFGFYCLALGIVLVSLASTGNLG